MHYFTLLVSKKTRYEAAVWAVVAKIEVKWVTTYKTMHTGYTKARCEAIADYLNAKEARAYYAKCEREEKARRIAAHAHETAVAN